jgi:hypothetical protein
MNAKLPHSHFVLFTVVLLSLASLEFCFTSFSFSLALFRIFFFVSRNLGTPLPTYNIYAAKAPTLAFKIQKVN